MISPRQIKHRSWSRQVGIVLTLLAVLLSGCGLSDSSFSATPAGGPVPGAVDLPGSLPSATSLPPPTATVTPSPVPSSTPTVTPSPTPTLFPLNILALRQTPFPGSQIVIEEKLADGPNYHRYYASYLSEGLKIYGLLTIPFSEKPEGGWPGIIFNHGYIPPDVYRTTERYVAYVDRLAASGYVVFRIDYRGHDRSEGEALGAYVDNGYITDVLNAVAALKQHPDVNGERIGMWGHSMGGFLTLRAMVISPDIKVGVIWGGVVGNYPDMMTKWRRTEIPTATPVPSTPGATGSGPTLRRWRTDLVKLFGTPDENPEFWASISANSYLSDISGPIQLHHATTDESVPVEFSESLYDQMLQAGKTVELYTYEGDDHNLSQSFSVAMARTIEFFDRYLKGN